MEVREPADEGEIRQAWQMLSRSFGWPLADEDKFVEGLGPAERCRVAVVDGEVAAFSRLRPFGQFHGGRRVAMGGHSPVGVGPEFRGRGLGTTITTAHYDAMRERGEVLAALYPATTRLYRGAGFEIAGVWAERAFPIRSLQMLPPGGGAARPRRAKREDVAAVKDCYRRQAVSRPGWLDRPDVWWDRILEKPWDERHLYVVDGTGGSIEGYIMYRHTSAADQAFGFGIAVMDVIADDRDVALALWKLVASSSTMVRQVSVVGPPEDPLLLLLPEQDLSTRHDLRWMLRLVDAPGAMAARGFRPVSVAVDLEIDDRHCEWTRGRWRLSVEGGEGRLEPGGDGSVRIGIGALASLYSGYAAAGTLAATGMLHGATEADVAALDAAFSGPTPWMSDFF